MGLSKSWSLKLFSHIRAPNLDFALLFANVFSLHSLSIGSSNVSCCFRSYWPIFFQLGINFDLLLWIHKLFNLVAESKNRSRPERKINDPKVWLSRCNNRRTGRARKRTKIGLTYNFSFDLSRLLFPFLVSFPFFLGSIITTEDRRKIRCQKRVKRSEKNEGINVGRGGA